MGGRRNKKEQEGELSGIIKRCGTRTTRTISTHSPTNLNDPRLANLLEASSTTTVRSPPGGATCFPPCPLRIRARRDEAADPCNTVNKKVWGRGRRKKRAVEFSKLTQNTRQKGRQGRKADRQTHSCAHITRTRTNTRTTQTHTHAQHKHTQTSAGWLDRRQDSLSHCLCCCFFCSWQRWWLRKFYWCHSKTSDKGWCGFPFWEGLVVLLCLLLCVVVVVDVEAERVWYALQRCFSDAVPGRCGCVWWCRWLLSRCGRCCCCLCRLLLSLGTQRKAKGVSRSGAKESEVQLHRQAPMINDWQIVPPLSHLSHGQ